MTTFTFLLASLRQYRRTHLAVAAGVAVAAAVITGALLVGDSMRGSLRARALAGLGHVDSVLTAENPFRADLAGETLAAYRERRRSSRDATRHIGEIEFDGAIPLLTARGALAAGAGRASRRATGLTVLGVPDEFWRLAEQPGKAPSATKGSDAGLAVSPTIATELGVADGDSVLLRLPTIDGLPADSALGEKEDATVSRRYRVRIVDAAAEPMIRFALRPRQQEPRNAFLPLAELQDLLELPQRANAIVFTAASGDSDEPTAAAERDRLAAALQPTLADYGLRLEPIPAGKFAHGGYRRLSAGRLVLPPAVMDVVADVANANNFRPGQPAVAYLANTISVADKKIPYSTVAGVDSTAELGPVVDGDGRPVVLADDECALNDWAAKALDAKVDDEVTLTYYEPETTHGRLAEGKPAKLKLRAIVPLADADGRPTAAADPALAPDLPGVTDQSSIDDWELPFELVEEVGDADEEYWDERRTTPKAFVSHALAARLWGSRWGTDSVVRWPLTGDDDAAVEAKSLGAGLLDRLKPQAVGMTLLPARELALRAASGTTPFDGLFLGFSMFLVASAVMLVALLFRLGVEQRARESGLLLAVGFSPPRLRRLALAEGALSAIAGAIVGAIAGIGYAATMIYGLNHWWSAATSAAVLQLHWTWRSLAIGVGAAVAVALGTMAWSLRKLVRLPPRQLLAGDPEPHAEKIPSASRIPWTAIVAAAAAIGSSVAGRSLTGEAQAGAFFGGGALALIAALAAVRWSLRRPSGEQLAGLTLAGLAVRNGRRNPGRTQLSLGLAAAASFLIVALSAFRLAPTDEGTGGFDLVATSDLPLHFDLGTDEGREQLGFNTRDNRRLAQARVVSCRVHDGEDASCLNLFQTAQPRVIGMPASIGNHDQFAWAAHLPLREGEAPAEPRRQATAPPRSVSSTTIGSAGASPSRSPFEGGGNSSPWMSLQSDLGDDDAGRPIVPMVLDRNTAMYSLKLYRVGDQLKLRDEFDRERTFQVVGLLANSVLQGEVLVDERRFLDLYPSSAGSRYFLIADGNAEEPAASAGGSLAELLESQLDDFGFDAVEARRRLADLMAVQNTYLSTFQSLGGLGLLLGVIGLAVAQLRSMLERRGELALMRAAGFSHRRLTQLVLRENAVLLAGGLAIGCVAALAAVLPHAWSQGAHVPWALLAKLVAGVGAAGLAAAWLAARKALRVPLLPALRGE